MATSMRMFSLKSLFLNKSHYTAFTPLTTNVLCSLSIPQIQQSASYAKKVGGAVGGGGKVGVGAAPVRKRLQPEQDPVKLVNNLCGGNILKEGTDPVLKPHSEYPDWLWTLKTERAPVPLEQLEPDTWPYWRRIIKLNKKMDLLQLRNKYKYGRF